MKHVIKGSILVVIVLCLYAAIIFIGVVLRNGI